MSTALPDPDRHAEFYADVPMKRLFAWGIDLVITGLLTAIVVVMTAFVGALILPLIFLTVSFCYRVITLARSSATPGMRLMSIEFLTHRGDKFNLPTAFLHTLGYTISISTILVQIVSITLMLTTARRQSLTDHLLGTVAINRPARIL